MVVIGEPARIIYTNYRGETAERSITPKRVWYGISDWHPEPQWFLTAFDHDKNADRDFALTNFGHSQPSSALEQALEEAARLCDARAEQCAEEHQAATLASVKAALAGARSEAMHLAHSIRALSSPDHADAGKVEGGGWQSMDKAPEDGTVILVYRDDVGVFTAHYVEEDAHLSSPMNPPEGDFYWFSTCGDDLTNDMPTHWRPIPSAPSQEVA